MRDHLAVLQLDDGLVVRAKRTAFQDGQGAGQRRRAVKVWCHLGTEARA